MQVFIISHFFFMKISLDIKTCICFLEKKHRRISEISFLPSLRHKLLCTVCNEIPCIALVRMTNQSMQLQYHTILHMQLFIWYSGYFVTQKIKHRGLVSYSCKVSSFEKIFALKCHRHSFCSLLCIIEISGLIL